MEKITEENFYKILCVAKTATDQEINKAYKKLAVKYHPDKNPDNTALAEENFKKASPCPSCGKRALHDLTCGVT